MDKNKKYIVKVLVSDINEPEKEFMKSNIIEAVETNIKTLSLRLFKKKNRSEIIKAIYITPPKNPNRVIMFP